MTYGQVANAANLPNSARLVGYAMAKAPDHIPWQRVVRKSRAGFGRVAIRDPFYASLQRQLLEQEGISFSKSDEIDLRLYSASASDSYVIQTPKGVMHD